MRVVNDAGIFVGFGGGQDDRIDRPDTRSDHDDQQRKDDAHAEYGDQDAPGEEPLLPDGRHVLEFVGIDDGIVEGERDFEYGKHRTDEGYRSEENTSELQ